MIFPQKSSDFNPPPPCQDVLNVSLPSNRTSLIATIPSSLKERISFYLRHNLHGNILSVIRMIYLYIQQRVLVAKSSHIKVSGQMSLIDSLIFKQQKTI